MFNSQSKNGKTIRGGQAAEGCRKECETSINVIQYYMQVLYTIYVPEVTCCMELWELLQV